jgi:hypothetical protein
MPIEDPHENDSGRRPPISPGLRRALVFAWLGPLFGLLVTFTLKAVADGGYPTDVGIGIAIVFFFSLIVCPTAGIVDGVLAYVVPIFLRAPLTATVGASIAVGLSLCLFGGSLTYRQMPAAIVAALAMGACSLLAHNHRVKPANSASVRRSLS